MRRTLLQFVSALLMASFACVTYSQTSPNSEALQAGLISLRDGNKTAAWEQLFPLAQRGDISAMYYLGEMFMRSPEYPDHLERAKQFLSAASKRNHKGAEALLAQLEEIVIRKAQAVLPSIAGASGMPTPQDHATLKAQYDRYRAEVLRYTDSLPDSVETARHQLSLFIRNGDPGLSTLQREINHLAAKHKDQVTSSIYLVLDPASWNPGQNPLEGLPIIDGGVTPDWGGQTAARHGAQRTPAFSITDPSGSHQTTYDLNEVKQKIQALLNAETAQ